MSFFLFFFNDTATTEIYTLSLHDALPIYRPDRTDHDRLAVPEQPVELPLPGISSRFRSVVHCTVHGSHRCLLRDLSSSRHPDTARPGGPSPRPVQPAGGSTKSPGPPDEVPGLSGGERPLAGPQTGQATLAQALRLLDHPGLIDVLAVKPAGQARISRQKQAMLARGHQSPSPRYRGDGQESTTR